MRLKDLLKNNRSSQKGVALIMAISSFVLLTWLATEVVYEATVEYTVNSQNLNRIKAYYAAKAAVDISLIRIKVYQTVKQQYGKMLGNNPYLEEIWRFPFAWPLPLPDGLNSVDKDAAQKLAKLSTMDASYTVRIEDEGSKIDITDLISKSKVLREATRKQLINILEARVKENEEFQAKYSGARWNELINNITDFMSDSNESLNGGDKKSNYKEIGTQTYPPNRAPRTLSELRFVPGMKEDIYRLLEPRLTLYGAKGINPNNANKETLRSLDQGITDEVAAAIIKRRSDQNEGGPFQSDNDFWSFIQSRGARIEGNPSDIPLNFDSVSSFRIVATGEFGRATREITAIVYDIDATAARIQDLIKKEQAASGGTSTTTNPNQNQPATTPAPAVGTKGPPRIVYWSER